MKKLTMLFTLALAAATCSAAPSNSSGKFNELTDKAYWSSGALPPGFKLQMDIQIDGDDVQYVGVNTTPGFNMTTKWSGKIDGVLYAFKGGYFDHILMKRISADEFLIDKYRDGDLVIGEFWQYVASTDEWIRHGVVAKSAMDGKSKTYVEYFQRAK